jgi:hypothetical protein
MKTPAQPEHDHDVQTREGCRAQVVECQRNQLRAVVSTIILAVGMCGGILAYVMGQVRMNERQDNRIDEHDRVMMRMESTLTRLDDKVDIVLQKLYDQRAVAPRSVLTTP